MKQQLQDAHDVAFHHTDADQGKNGVWGGDLQQVWALAHGQHLVVRQSTLVMAILNVTPDSFSDGGVHLDTCASAGASTAAAGAAPVTNGPTLTWLCVHLLATLLVRCWRWPLRSRPSADRTS